VIWIVAVCSLAVSACWPLQAGTRKVGPDEAFEAAKPAVVIVESENAVTWSIPTPEITPAKQKEATDRLIAMVRAGQVALNQKAIDQALIKLVLDDPGHWFSASKARLEQTDPVPYLGSGFFITENGYLITNDHVVDTTPDDIKALAVDELESEDLNPNTKDLASFRDSLSKDVGVSISDAQSLKFFHWMIGFFKAEFRVLSVKPTYRIGFGSMTADEVKASGLTADLVAHGAAAPGRDIAVLKVAGGPYPSLAIAPSGPAAKSQLVVVGYPCSCTDVKAADPRQTLTPVMTHGIYQGREHQPAGWDAIKTDAHAEHGNSGGPVFDDRGQVVGVMTWGDREAATRQHNFAVPMDVARQFTNMAGVHPAQGKIGQTYTQAIAEFHEQHYRQALPLFQSVAGKLPSSSDGDMQHFVADSKKAIAAGRDRTPPTIGELLPYVVGAAGAMVGVGVLALMVVLRRRRRRAAERQAPFHPWIGPT